MKELGAQLDFCHRTKSYVYLNDITLIVGNGIKDKMKGGSNSKLKIKYSLRSSVALDDQQILLNCQRC